MNFIGRKKELEILSERFKSNKAEFLIIYGRRRIGKTELIKTLVTKQHPGIILIGREESKKLQLERYSRILAEYFNDELLKIQGFADWDAFNTSTNKLKSSVSFWHLMNFHTLLKMIKPYPPYYRIIGTTNLKTATYS
jgi:AAA+ ATPase superfamily predicted ATPase